MGCDREGDYETSVAPLCAYQTTAPISYCDSSFPVSILTRRLHMQHMQALYLFVILLAQQFAQVQLCARQVHGANFCLLADQSSDAVSFGCRTRVLLQSGTPTPLLKSTAVLLKTCCCTAQTLLLKICCFTNTA